MHSALPKTITICRGVPSQNFEHNMQRGLWCCNAQQQRNARGFVRRGRRIQKEVRACVVLISFEFLQRTRLVHAQLQAFRSGQSGPLRLGGARPYLGRSRTIPRGGRSLAWLYRVCSAFWVASLRRSRNFFFIGRRFPACAGQKRECAGAILPT